MTRAALHTLIMRKQSMLCIGLDTDIALIPPHLLAEPDPVFAFNKAIIDATLDIAIAYKPNIAFYEAMGVLGWQSLERTMEYLHQYRDQVFTIADAKRGDIGNTSRMYARTFFDWLGFDAVTVAPYMGEDSVAPFLGYTDKWVILLGLTSNSGSADFQMLRTGTTAVYEQVITRAQRWASPDQLMYVVGATHPELFAEVRALAPDYFMLVPGIGAQGGDIASVCKHGMNSQAGLLINSARQIIYASKGIDYATLARAVAHDTRAAMQPFL
jgi:orotidine-5'-phosphate decarboxylase